MHVSTVFSVHVCPAPMVGGLLPRYHGRDLMAFVARLCRYPKR